MNVDQGLIGLADSALGKTFKNSSFDEVHESWIIWSFVNVMSETKKLY